MLTIGDFSDMSLLRSYGAGFGEWGTGHYPSGVCTAPVAELWYRGYFNDGTVFLNIDPTLWPKPVATADPC